MRWFHVANFVSMQKADCRILSSLPSPVKSANIGSFNRDNLQNSVLYKMNDYKGEYIYLASPYTSEDILVREVRFLEVVRAAAYVINKLRINAFAAIAFSHSLAVRYTMPCEWEFWADYDQAMISHAVELWVVAIPGFTNSMGVQTELKIAHRLGKQVRWLIPILNSQDYVLTDIEPMEYELYGKVEPGRLLKEKVNDGPELNS